MTVHNSFYSSAIHVEHRPGQCWKCNPTLTVTISILGFLLNCLSGSLFHGVAGLTMHCSTILLDIARTVISGFIWNVSDCVCFYMKSNEQVEFT